MDLSCSTPKCGHKVADHVVDTRSSIADDLHVKVCPKCGAKGSYAYVKAVKPPAPIPVSVPVKPVVPTVTDAPQTEPTPDA